jgi:hypothetical protein
MQHPVAPTAHQSERMARIKEIGCVIARMRGLGFVPCEVHHLLSGGKRRGHDFTVGLNPWSHEAKLFDKRTAEECFQSFGPSLKKGSKPFHAEHGSDDELLAIQNALLEAAGFDTTPQGDRAPRKAPSRKGKSQPIRSRGFPKRDGSKGRTASPAKMLPRTPL